MKYLDALATFWQRNAELRHGHLPRVGDVQGPVPTAPSLLSKAVPLVLSAVLGGGGMAAVPFVVDWIKGGAETPPAVAAPEAQERDGSLYQYLEDEGMHLPE